MSQRTSAGILTLSEAEIHLRQQFNELLKLSLQAVAHRKKIQLSMTQFSRFLDSFRQIANDEKMSPVQLEAYQIIIKIARDYYSIISQQFLHCWAHSVIDNSCSQVAADLTMMASCLHDATIHLDPNGAENFDASDPQWLQFHILDLNAVIASFTQFLSGLSNGNNNQKIALLMEAKLRSINKFLEEYENEGFFPGARIFSPIPMNYQIWRIERTDFVMESQEGSGGVANVFYGHFLPTGQEVAIKKLKYGKLTGTRLNIFQREVVILATAKHPAVLEFVGATDAPPYCILTEWMAGGSLYQELNQKHRLDQTMLTKVAYDIARGMAFLHKMKIIHRDLKSLNVLLDSKGNAKICDFGFSRFKNSDDDAMTQNIGTPHWMAPELLGGSTNYNEKIDVYAYGIVLWEILMKQLPYQNMEQNDVIGQVLVKDIRPPIPDDTPEELKNLIQKCWNRDASKRPSFTDILTIWRTGKVLYPGADKDLIAEYLDIPLDDAERACSDVESHLSSSDSSGIEKFAETLEKDGIPPELADRCWSNLQSINHVGHEEAYCKCLLMFLKTEAVRESASVLRDMPPNSLSYEKVLEICELIPSGYSNLEDDLVMIACKNNGIEEVLLRSIEKKHLTLALELLARSGIRHPEMKDAVIQRAIQVMECDDTCVKIAATRFFVANNFAHLIPMNVIQNNMKSRNITLKNASYVAAAKIAEEGHKLPSDLIEVCASLWRESALAGTVIVNACRNRKTASAVLNRIAYGAQPPPEISAMILAQCSNHIELRGYVKMVMKQMTFPKCNLETKKALRILQNLPEEEPNL
ncbi:TKL family protein kinase [Tritrichomonas foetus]|uniref:TKL family protein kinase n=1 Tax=Tritrichomonas foetus TaxID=1144522 RepID=A0A1J4KQM2_9EUKA|nr:TKL family protein kinase [Tritrichomonas foetus]|eukprot:OHT13599.1 TKL family protein kinase [Tritrichomonas foetus]